VLDWIKRHARLRRVPVVVLTSSKTSTDIERAYDLGANSYLTKPLCAEGLLSMVTQINSYWLSLNERAVVRRAGT
jgi:CheY-like chemotaxis protein